MTEVKTAPRSADPREFVAALEHPVRRSDAEYLMEMMADVTGQPAILWGPSIIGFGAYHYRYASGREGDACAVGFSPRKTSLSLYGLTYGPDAPGILPRLGKHKVGAACLYVNKLADVDLDVLRGLTATGYRHVMDNLHNAGAAHPST